VVFPTFAELVTQRERREGEVAAVAGRSAVKQVVPSAVGAIVAEQPWRGQAHTITADQPGKM
jgi:hypothetical protein